mmetsp:Transcript_2236/g.6057  ORF Transcript_2236/g.6057 Transcript_2236/m.6057 type:complete len:84 (-) Transcript_2236:476-727(-)
MLRTHFFKISKLRCVPLLKFRSFTISFALVPFYGVTANFAMPRGASTRALRWSIALHGALGGLARAMRLVNDVARLSTSAEIK